MKKTEIENNQKTNLDFINDNAGKKIWIFYEYHLGSQWGDEGTIEIVLDKKGLEKAKKLIKSHNIYEIKLVK